MFIMQNLQPRGSIMYISILDTRDGALNYDKMETNYGVN